MQRTKSLWLGYAASCVLLTQVGCSSDPTANGAAVDGSVADDGSGSAGKAGDKTGSNGSSLTSNTFIPMFPGAGTGNASDPLVGGKLCDYKPHAGEKGGKDPLTECFFEPGKTKPAATLEQVLECAEGTDTVHLRLTFDPAFVDNTYGANAIGWEARMKGAKAGMMKPPKMMMAAMEPKAAHTWKDLVGSDHAELIVSNADGETALHFSLDYISEDPTSPSGYSTLCANGGDGKIFEGDAASIVSCSTSIDRNFNERGYGSYTVDSPATDADYTPNAAAPAWDFRVVYEAWIDVAAFGSSGFGGAKIEYVHASPSKFPDNTIVVIPGDCPPDWCNNPDGCDGTEPPPGTCNDPDGCDGGGTGSSPDACVVGGPDDSCYGGGLGPDAGSDFCASHPDDVSCLVD